MKTDLKKDNRGMTLAELIVTFALMGIFLAAVAGVISSSIIMHGELTGTMYAQTVGETLLDKVTGELSSAKPKGSKAMVLGEVLQEGNVISNGISFYDKDGKKSYFYVENGVLIIKADDIWKMDEKAYMGYRISEFSIRKLNEENILEVVIKIKNLKTGFEYTTSRVVECYNFTGETDFLKIVSENIIF